MVDNRNIVYTLKYLTYFGIFLGLYLVETMPTFLSVIGIKPLLIVPAAVAIAMHDGEFIGGIFGAVAGMFWDMQEISLFGFDAALLLVYCVAVGLVVIHYMQNNVKNFCYFSAAILAIRTLLVYFFEYQIWGYEKVWLILFEKKLPTILYTLLVGPLMFYLFKWLSEFFNSKVRI